MGHPELLAECDINQVESLLPQDVVDDLLSKYVQTFTVSNLAFFFFSSSLSFLSYWQFVDSKWWNVALRSNASWMAMRLLLSVSPVKYYRLAEESSGNGQEGLAERNGAWSRPGWLLPNYAARHCLSGTAQAHSCTHPVPQEYQRAKCCPQRFLICHSSSRALLRQVKNSKWYLLNVRLHYISQSDFCTYSASLNIRQR